MKSIKRIIVVGLAVFSLTACSDYLDKLPDNRTIVDSRDKIEELLVEAYPKASYMPIAELMSDNFGDKENLSATNDMALKLYTWDIPFDINQDSPTAYWGAAYKAIEQANTALQAIEKYEGKIEDLDGLKGEALLSRAYAHFMLVNLWAKHYAPATAGTDLGVAYITKPQEKATDVSPRNTVAEVYNMIEQDIQKGLALVVDKDNKRKYHFNKEAARALAVRFYLYKGDWDKVIEYADELLANGYKLRDWKRLRKLQYGQIQNEYSSSSEPTNMLLVYTSSIYARTFATGRFGLSEAKWGETFRNGAGHPAGGVDWIYPIYGRDLSYNMPKFIEYFKYTNITEGIGYPYVANVLFSYDEVAMARAEAYAMKGNFTESLTDINAILEAMSATSVSVSDNTLVTFYANAKDEYKPYYDLTDKQASYIKAIAELRRRSYYFEGLRWFDIKRFNLKVEHNLANSLDPIILEPNDNRKLLQLPESTIAAGVTPNPR